MIVPMLFNVETLVALDQAGGIVTFFTTISTACLCSSKVPSLDTLVVAVGLVALAFWCKKQQEVKEDYDTYHTFWHLSLLLGQLQLNYILML